MAFLPQPQAFLGLQEKHGTERRAVVICKKMPSAATRYRLTFSVMRSRPVCLTSDEQWLVAMAWEMMLHEFRGKWWQRGGTLFICTLPHRGIYFHTLDKGHKGLADLLLINLDSQKLLHRSETQRRYLSSSFHSFSYYYFLLKRYQYSFFSIIFLFYNFFLFCLLNIKHELYK